MKENSVAVLRAFLSGFGAACLLLAGAVVMAGWATGGPATEAGADDLAAIEKLHRADIAANDEKQLRKNSGVKVLAYRPDFRDLQVAGGWAIEWGYFDTSFLEFAEGQAKSFREKFLRMMKRQPDGSWKFSRVMWNPAQ